MSGKGDKPRPLAIPPSEYRARYDAIDWSAHKAPQEPKGVKPTKDKDNG